MREILLELLLLGAVDDDPVEPERLARVGEDALPALADAAVAAVGVHDPVVDLVRHPRCERVADCLRDVLPVVLVDQAAESALSVDPFVDGVAGDRLDGVRDELDHPLVALAHAAVDDGRNVRDQAAELLLARLERLGGLALLARVEQVALAVERTTALVGDRHALVEDRHDGAVGRDQPVLAEEVLVARAGALGLRLDPALVLRVQEGRDELRLGEPAIGREAEQLLDLRADEDGRAVEAVDVGDERQALDQGSVLGRLERTVPVLRARQPAGARGSRRLRLLLVAAVALALAREEHAAEGEKAGKENDAVEEARDAEARGARIRRPHGSTYRRRRAHACPLKRGHGIHERAYAAPPSACGHVGHLRRIRRGRLALRRLKIRRLQIGRASRWIFPASRPTRARWGQTPTCPEGTCRSDWA